MIDFYQYRMSPMGCSVSADLLQSSLIFVWRKLYFKACIIYGDDILVYSRGNEHDNPCMAEDIVTALKKAHAVKHAPKPISN